MTEDLRQLVSLLTPEEKISLTTGDGAWHTAAVPRLDIPQVTMSDGPAGLRKELEGKTLPAVCMPSLARIACGFDPDQAYAVGVEIGKQCLANGVDLLLAPGVNIKRDPRCGRNFEYLSEDPMVAGEIAVGYVNGVQSTGVGACVKHFAANNSEYGRMVCDSVVDERALREIYLEAFRRVVTKAKPRAVMCSYNKVNGVYASQNRKLLTGILRGEWGFDGVTVSDWGATDDRVAGIAAGLNLEMPQNRTDLVKKALGDGTLDEQQLDEAVIRVLGLVKSRPNKDGATVDNLKQHKLCRKVAAETAVLVKNSCKLLPIKKDDKIALIGALAEKPAYQGGGSACVNSVCVDNLVDALAKAKVNFHYAEGYSTDGETTAEMTEKACTYAKNCDKVVLVIGDTHDTEASDRKGVLPEEQLQLLEQITSVNANVIVVLQCGAPVDVSWAAGVKTLLIDYYAGEAEGSALCDVLTGTVSPQGRLAETWHASLPLFDSDFAKDYHKSYYRESVYVGYRYTTSANKPVAFPFGFGMGYGDMTWGKPYLSQDVLNKGKVKVCLTVTNNGDVKDSEVVQVYATNLDGRDFYPKKSLVAFKKVTLKPQQSKEVKIDVNIDDLAHFDVAQNKFVTNGGKYVLTVGRHANDDVNKLTLVVGGANDTADRHEQLACYYDVDEKFNPTDEQFATLYGRDLPVYDTAITPSTAVGDLPVKGYGKMLYDEIVKPTDSASHVRWVESSPVRNFVGDNLPWMLVDTYIEILNCKPTLKQKISFARLKKKITNKNNNT